MSGTLIVLRHGQTAWNAEGRIQGQLDVELTELGIEQAAAAARRLAELRPDAIVSSDLRRAADTAAALAALTGVPVRFDPRLRERDFGLWQGLTGAEAAARYPEEYARWQSGEPIDGCDVESREDLAKRASAGLQEAADLVPGGTVVAVMHGGAARHGVVALLGWPPEILPGLAPLANCRWMELRHDAVRGWQMRGYNLS
jgi:probable phosphoglycerate mutase